jgi:excisionase family DNA binding protein
MPFYFFIDVTRANTREGDKEMKALKSVEDAAGFLGISKWTVRAYIKAGKLRPVRLGRRVLLPEEELERLIVESQERRNEQSGHLGL